MYKIYLKRLIDVFGAVTGIALLALPMFFIAVAIKLDSKGPVFFKQKRVGKNKEHFNILKFRTMRIEAPKDCPTHMLNNAESCITRVGAILRKTSLDEIPQLFNILKGQMSFVGPRPALWNQYDLIEERDKYGANDIVPGLTGWAQINGRDELEIPVKAKLDGKYVEKQSFFFDTKIFFSTFIKVFRKDGIQEGAQSSYKLEQSK